MLTGCICASLGKIGVDSTHRLGDCGSCQLNAGAEQESFDEFNGTDADDTAAIQYIMASIGPKT
jgi:hypothetical protein